MTGIVDPFAQGHETRPPTRARVLRRIVSSHGPPGCRGKASRALGQRRRIRLFQRRLAVVVVVVLGLAAMLGGVVFLRGLGNQLQRGVSAQVTSGTTLETSGERGWVRLSVNDAIPEGARVRTGSSEARLKLREGQVWLGADAAARIFSQRIDLIRGEAMVVNSAGGMLSARWTDVVVSGHGVFRLTPGVDPRIGVYAGSAHVRRLAESLPVTALEQLSLSTRRLPGSPAPLGYEAQDPWDRGLLGQAIAFDEEVERIARGIDVKFARTAKPPEFYRAFKAVDDTTIPILKSTARTITPDGQFGPASDVLVTLFVAQAAAEVTGKPLPGAITQTATWRAEGARWGIIAMRFGITASDFAETVDLSQIDRLTEIGGSQHPALVEAGAASKTPSQPNPPPGAPPAAGTQSAGMDSPSPTPSSDISSGTLVPLPVPVPYPSPSLPAVPDMRGEDGGITRSLRQSR
jgi:hypothetical protein